MKLSSMTLALAVLAMLGVGFVSGCGKDSSSTPATPTTEKAEDAVKDAADKTEDAVKDAADKAGDAVKDAADNVGDKVEEAKDAM